MRILDGTNLTALAEHLAQQLVREAREPLHRQLYRQLRSAVRQGWLAPGSPLPASRSLAQELGLGRNTVLHAYEQLCAEGYCQGRPGAGTFVSLASPDQGPAPAADVPPTGAERGLAHRAEALLEQITLRPEHPAAAFQPGLPDLAAFPWPLWWKLLHAQQKASTPAELGYRSDGGHPALRQALADYLRLSRGVNCTAEQILISGGMQQSLDLLARSLAEAGETAWIEEPGYSGAAQAFQAAGLVCQPVPLDAGGLHWQGASLPHPRLIYVTPSHQYPLGCVMPLARRHALLAEAARQDAWIIEDDYDSEFRHTGQPLAALQGLDRQGRVLYLGTFSKVMFPALRLGYLVVPPALLAPLRSLQARLYRESDYPTQAALADFIRLGHFGSHLRRMRGVYARRQAKLRDVLHAELGDALQLMGGEAGMHMTARLPDGSDDRAISAALAKIGLCAPPLADYCLGTPPFPGLVLGYAGVAEDALLLNAVRLAAVLRGFGIGA